MKVTFLGSAALLGLTSVPGLCQAQSVTNLSSDHFYGPKAIDVTQGDPRYKVISKYKFPPENTSGSKPVNPSIVNVFGSDVTSKTYSYVPDKLLGLDAATYKVSANYATSSDNKFRHTVVNTFGSEVHSKPYSYVPDKSLGLGAPSHKLNSSYHLPSHNPVRKTVVNTLGADVHSKPNPYEASK